MTTGTGTRTCFIDWPTMADACVGIAALDRAATLLSIPQFEVHGIHRVEDGAVSVQFGLHLNGYLTPAGDRDEDNFHDAAAVLGGEHTGS